MSLFDEALTKEKKPVKYTTMPEATFKYSRGKKIEKFSREKKTQFQHE